MSSERSSRVLKGLPTARGVACGPAFVFRGEGVLSIPEVSIPPGGEEAVVGIFRAALAAARRDVEGLIARLARAGEDERRIFESQLMLLDDPLLLAATERAIRERRLNAAAAVREVGDACRARFAKMTDAYFRERVRDVEDVERRLLQHILGLETNLPIDVPAPSVFVADDLSPSDAVRLPMERVLAIVLAGGSPTSHVALLARAMGIPAVTGAAGIFDAAGPGELVIVNGTTGEVTANPDKLQLSASRRASLRNLRRPSKKEPGLLKDGSSGALVFANMHPGLPTESIALSGATGIGLYRSEYLWINADREPTEEEQFAAYRAAAEFASSLSPKGTLSLRTLDIGGDKIVRGLVASEANPFLGNRSIRYLLSHPETFRTQLRAILRASAYGRICLLHPMVSCVEEIVAAERALAAARAELDREGVRYDRAMPVGAMIEIPAAALNAAALAKHADFFSIGTNDLVQYTLAADRGNQSVAALYQPTHPAVLELVRRTLAAAKANDIPVSVCGESAGDPVLGVLWVAMGVDLLSVSPGYVRPLARVLASLTRADLDAYAAAAEAVDPSLPGPEIYQHFRNWLKARVPDFDACLA